MDQIVKQDQYHMEGKRNFTSRIITELLLPSGQKSTFLTVHQISLKGFGQILNQGISIPFTQEFQKFPKEAGVNINLKKKKRSTSITSFIGIMTRDRQSDKGRTKGKLLRHFSKGRRITEEED